MRVPSPTQRRVLEVLASDGEIHLDKWDRATLMPANEFIPGHVMNALRRTNWLARDRSVNRPRTFRITSAGREALASTPRPRTPRPRLDPQRARQEIIWPDPDGLLLESGTPGAEQQLARDAKVDWRTRAVLTEREVAEALKVSRETMFRLRSLGRVGYYRIGSLIRYAPKHVLEYLESIERSPRQRR